MAVAAEKAAGRQQKWQRQQELAVGKVSMKGSGSGEGSSRKAAANGSGQAAGKGSGKAAGRQRGKAEAAGKAAGNWEWENGRVNDHIGSKGWAEGNGDKDEGE